MDADLPRRQDGFPWVKGDAEYVRDCISVFEEYGWDWTYHAYREWPGWDVDYDAVGDALPTGDRRQGAPDERH